MRRLLILMMTIPLFAACMRSASAEGTVIPPAYPVPEHVSRLIEVALEELGNGRDRSGATKYGIWSGHPTVEWCSDFLCWSVDQVDQRYGTQLLTTLYPLYSSSNTGRAFFIQQGRYVARSGHMSPIEGGGYQWYKGEDHYLEANSYIPQPGDWVFFTWTGGTDTDHVAMVEYCARDTAGAITVHVIDGNNPSVVSRNVYRLTDKSILGYGTVHDAVDWTLRYSDKGTKVLYLQNRLAYLGFLEVNLCDGLYGRKTMAAVDAFQREQMPGKRANGIADITTQNAMNAACLVKMKEDITGYLVIDED
jgi:hypothetical protein